MTALAELDRARYSRMRWNTPLSEEHADLLLQRFDIPPGACVVDLGCGWGELLLRAVNCDGATGIGVDTDARALERGKSNAISRGLQARVSFVNEPAAQWAGSADRVMCIGASHAFGGAERALLELAKVVAHGGRLLFGNGCWCEPPAEPAAALFGTDVSSLRSIVERATAAGWRVMHLSTADQREWDDFESTWRAGREEWLLGNAADAQALSVRSELNARLIEYISVYRGILDFCYLVLVRVG